MSTKTGIVFLNYLRKDHAAQTMETIVKYRGDSEIFEVDMYGIAAAANTGIRHFFAEQDCDYVILCSNDILMPEDWLETLIRYAQAIPETGLSTFYCVETLPPMETINGLECHPNWLVFGNSFITRKAFETIGYFNTEQDPYGIQDMDYCYRLTKAGFKNYYIANKQATHIGHDVGYANEYRKMKDQSLQKASAIYYKWVDVYNNGDLYLPYLQGSNWMENKEMNAN